MHTSGEIVRHFCILIMRRIFTFTYTYTFLRIHSDLRTHTYIWLCEGNLCALPYQFHIYLHIICLINHISHIIHTTKQHTHIQNKKNTHKYPNWYKRVQNQFNLTPAPPSPGGVFIVIFVGIGLACVTLAFEYWWYKHRKGPRVTDSAKVLSVREIEKTEKSNFNTEYK